MSQTTRYTTDRQRGSLRDVVAHYGRARITGWQGLVLVVILAAGLRLYDLGGRSFHGDEMLSVTMASSKTMSELQSATKPAWHPPLHYGISRLLYLAGAHTESQWRMAGVLFGVLLAGATFLIPLVWGSPRLSLPAGLLAATSPMAVLFSQTSRWHPIVAGILAVACLSLAVAVKRDAMWAWLVAGVAFALAFYTVFLAGVVAIVLMLLALHQVLKAGKPLTGWLSAAVLCLAAVAPLARPAIFWSRPGQIFWEPVRSVFPLFGKLGLLLQNLAVGPTVLPWNWAVMVPAALLLAYIGWRFIASSETQVRSIRGAAIAFFVLCLPVIVVAPVAAFSRYWLILLVPLHIGIAGGLLSITSRRLQVVCTAALAALVAYALFNLYTHRQYQYRELIDDWRGMAARTRSIAQPGDEVWSVMAPFVHYYGSGSLDVFAWYYDKTAVARRIEQTGANRVFLQYSFLSGWEVVNFTRIGEIVGEELTGLGFKRQWWGQYGRDPDVVMKRKYLRGRSFPEYRHVVELWVRPAPRHE